MNRRSGLEHIAISAVALTAGCFLDTTPIAAPESSATGPVMLSDAGATASQAPETSPAQTPPLATSLDAAIAPATDAAGMTATTAAPGRPATVTPPPSTPPSTSNAMADAGTATPPNAPCTGIGSYALRATLDVTWDETAWSDVGRGTVELYGLLQTEAVDPHTPATSARFRVCGLTLPTLISSALCSSYELQFPESIWTGSQLPEQALGATYECDAASCVLQVAPISYALGIRLTDAQGPWPELEDTSLSQFADDDGDGFAGVSVDVMSRASLDVMSGASVPSGESACTPSDGPQAPGNPANTPRMPGNPMTGPTTTPALPIAIGRLLLGLRSQLTAAMTFTRDCQVSGATASGVTLSMRSGGCFVTDGMDPATATMSCSEELRASIDESLPSYEVLEHGDRAKGSGMNDKRPSDGPLLQAVRLAPSAPADCEQVRSAKF